MLDALNHKIMKLDKMWTWLKDITLYVIWEIGLQYFEMQCYGTQMETYHQFKEPTQTSTWKNSMLSGLICTSCCYVSFPIEKVALKTIGWSLQTLRPSLGLVNSLTEGFFAVGVPFGLGSLLGSGCGGQNVLWQHRTNENKL